ncbi:MAG TPA: hypothetical protein PK347_11995 [Burkholderiaceae bacterium]|nr:hypothetical protein [Burkholderiaceae bacterium]
MFTHWMQKWLVAGWASMTRGNEAPMPASRVTSYTRAVPDWQVPAYLRRRLSGDRLRA